ncbi:MAG: hypothetical protein SFY81_00565 [Verrucomicrobiota bacterium]|nr:hypothetical protein [Verrucomicrobiota bacterium]
MQKIAVIFGEESKELNPAELADFLFLFRAMNLALDRLVPESERNDWRIPTQIEASHYLNKMAGFNPQEINSFFNASNKPDLLQIDEVSRHSPLEILYIGCPLLITLAVIFSGGKISLKVAGTGFEAKVNSLGDGIKGLRDAFGIGRRLRVGYGVKSVVVKLTNDEYSELMRQPPESKNKGGFQHFLVGLQDRVNKQTREIELTERDLERIFRFKANPSKGGWQSRFKKIFGRIFSEGGTQKSLPNVDVSEVPRKALLLPPKKDFELERSGEADDVAETQPLLSRPKLSPRKREA